jgi:hypothetical protein
MGVLSFERNRYCSSEGGKSGVIDRWRRVDGELCSIRPDRTNGNDICGSIPNLRRIAR